MGTMQRYPNRPGGSDQTFPLGLLIGLGVGGLAASLALTNARRQAQLARVRNYPDSAPPLARRSQPAGRYTRAGYAVTINKPRSELYAFWRDFHNLPRFMENVEAMAAAENGVMAWTIAAPAGFSVNLRTRITEDREGEIIAWQSVEGSTIDAKGRVTFRDAPPGRGTIVEALVAYRPPGGELGRWVAKLFQREPAIQGRRELKRLKMLMETGEIATSNNRKTDD